MDRRNRSASRTLGPALAFMGAIAMGAAAQIVNAQFDILSPGEPGYDSIPSNYLILDGFVDVASTDLWAGSQVWWQRLDERISFNVEPDPNVADGGTVINPGHSTDCSVSRPMARDDDARWLNCGAQGGGSPQMGTGFSAAWSPLGQPPAGVDGFTVRTAVFLGPGAPPHDTFFVSTTPPPPDAAVFAITPTGWSNRTLDVPTPSVTYWYLWSVVPEPGCAVPLLLCGLMAARRRCAERRP
jgi:hypothetical protein